MKRLMIVLVLIGLVASCAYAPKRYNTYEKGRAVTVSHRVGVLIEAQEREQFDLLRGIQDFKTAKYYAIHGGGYIVEIVTTSEMFLAVNRDTLAVSVLRDYINRYEEVLDSRDDFEAKWQIVDYDDPGQPITRHEIGQESSAMLFGAACCLGGGIASGLLGYLMTYSLVSGSSIVPMVAVTAAGALSSGAIGLMYGSRFNEGRVLRKIKEARKPRLAE